MGERSVAELVEILYRSSNDVWRDDAAGQLASAPHRAEAEAALLDAIDSPAIDDSLRRTCAESLATIWVDQGRVNEFALARLAGMPREVVESFLLAKRISN